MLKPVIVERGKAEIGKSDHLNLPVQKNFFVREFYEKGRINSRINASYHIQ
jgi:hypothetical protein